MRILGVKNLMAKVLVFTLLIYFYAGAESISSEVGDEEGERQVEPAEYQTKLLKKIYDSLTRYSQQMDEEMGLFRRMLSTVIDEQWLMEVRMDQLASTVYTIEVGQRDLDDELRYGASRQQRLREKILSVSEGVDSVLTSRVQNAIRESTDCRGNVELARGGFSSIRYGNPGNNANCVWTIISPDNFTSYGIKFMLLGRETRVEGLRINYWERNHWDREARLRSEAVTEFGSWITIPAPHVFITFCPNPNNVRLGFEASFLGFGTSKGEKNFKPSWFGNSTETFDFSVSHAFTECIATQKPLTNSTECGGKLELARGLPSTIRYASRASNKNCEWAINPRDVEFASYAIKLESLGTEPRVKGVRVNYWLSNQTLQSQAITEFGSWITIDAPYVLITFCPNPNNVRLGFEASIIGFGTSSNLANFKPSLFGNSTETFDFSVSKSFTECIATQKPLTNLTECGGNLELARGVPSTIRYTNPANNTNCVWTIIPPGVQFASYAIKLESLGTETRVEGVSVNYWDSRAKLQAQTVTNFGFWIPVPSPYIFITFCPSPNKVNTGFEASIIGYGTSSKAVNFKPTWFANSTDTFDFSVSDEFTECIATQMPLTSSTDCGGNLEVVRGVPSTIRYPNPGTNQSCVWKLVQQADFASYRIKFKSLGTETRPVGVLVYFGNSTAEIRTLEITEFGTWITIPGPNVFITFCSNPTNVSSGFEASIIGLGTSSRAANLESSWFQNSTEAFNFLLSENFSHCIGTQKPMMTSTACGGILEVARGALSTIDYPNGYDRRCVWTIAAKVKFASYYIKIQSFGMDMEYDGVKIYFWDSGVVLQSVQVTEFDFWIPIPAPYAVITLCDGHRRGFGASIVGVGTSTDSAILRPFWLLTNSTESFSYPQNISSTRSNNEMVSVAIQPRYYRSVSVRAPQIGNDTLKSYQLTCYYYRSENPNYSLMERSDGGSSSSANYQFEAQGHPFLVIFKSNARNDGVRFTISY